MTHSFRTPTLLARILVLVPILTSCARLTESPRQLSIDFVLLQPAEMPIGWNHDWMNKEEGQCKGEWTIFTYSDSDPNVTHVVFDCASEEAAKTLFYQKSTPDLNASRSPIGGNSKPAHADEYLAYCDTPEYKILQEAYKEVSMKNCTTLARYGRVVSMMMVNAILPTAKWPLEADLLKWTIERNDAKLVKLAQ